YEIDGESIGKYISGIYDFTAGFVGIIAMFMLVIAGWQWLFAAGSADKINNAKGTINGVLIGLALLFGGHIILEQISVRLTEFEGITMDEIAGRTSSCHGLSEASCNKFSVDCRWNKKSDHTWGCVNVSIKDLCHERTKKSECDESQSCEWSGFNCVPSTVPRCGLSKEEVSGGGMMNVYCCQKDGEVKYSYDPMPVQYCSALCGEGWGGAPKNLCYLRLEY
ncbi:MAG: hypothetical protein HOA57_03770, partial [Candidatus Magasanikbacteria bacterium]|nr:hypothetical protein [Candidatus Magasanikbacteria bacterium]